MEFGPFGKDTQDAATRVIDANFPGYVASVSCLHRNKLDSKSNQDQMIQYEDFAYLMIHMISFYAICS